MNLRKPNANSAIGTFNRSRSVVPMSGICTDCLDGCKGGCEVWLASFRGRETIYPGPFGDITAGADKNYPVDYSHLNINGYAMGARGLPKGMKADPDDAIFPNADTETEYGWNKKVKMKVPIFTGALGSTDIARKNWEHFAIGAAISGVTLVCGENVCGIDPKLELDKNGKIKNSPEMDRRIETYKKFYDGYGEIRVRDIKRAQELKKRGYVVTPDPTLPEVIRAYREKEIKEFERHSRLGFVTQEAFMKEVQRLRKLGFKRITLKTGAYPAVELAMALRYGADAKIDLLTIDGAPGGTGMSPWNMMNEWGVPTFYLQALTYEFAEKLRKRKIRIPDLAIAGGFSEEAGIFKAIAMGSPFVKAVCMGRALMIPGMVGKNIGRWLDDGSLPKSVSKHGHNIEEIFVTYEELKEKYGKEIKNIPLGAIGIYTFSQKIKVGLQQLMAGSRNFSLKHVERKDLVALTPEAAEISGIPYVMQAYRKEAEKILKS